MPHKTQEDKFLLFVLGEFKDTETEPSCSHDIDFFQILMPEGVLPCYRCTNCGMIDSFTTLDEFFGRGG